MTRQLPLPLPAAPSYAASDLVAGAANAAARAWLERPETWPAGRLALWGAAGVGKTHLLRATAAARGWAVLDGAALRALPAPPGRGIALDDAEAAAEEPLLHLANACAERRLPLLLAAREPPARWPVALPDLRSRLRATTAVPVRAPEEALLAAMLEKLLADRQLRVEPGLRAWLLARLPREAAAVALAAARLDRAALAAGGRVTRPLARTALAGLPGFGAEDDDPETATGVPSGKAHLL